jgi:3-methyladenine DNA glycosylase/8-oxoguanine DNA glycosylase
MVAGGFVIGVAALLLIGKYYPGSGAEVLDWKPTRSAELEAELEQGDIQQMLEAQNERRRLRGAPERTLEDVERDVARNLSEYRDLQQRLESISEEADWRES